MEGEGFSLRRIRDLGQGVRGSSNEGKNIKHIWRGGNLPRVMSLNFSLFL